jgi:hypothetical protein
LLPFGLALDEQAYSIRVCVQRPVNVAPEVANRLPRSIADSLRCQL